MRRPRTTSRHTFVEDAPKSSLLGKEPLSDARYASQVGAAADQQQRADADALEAIRCGPARLTSAPSRYAYMHAHAHTTHTHTHTKVERTIGHCWLGSRTSRELGETARPRARARARANKQQRATEPAAASSLLRCRRCQCHNHHACTDMFGLFYGCIQYSLRKPEYYVLIIGLDNAGKTVGAGGRVCCHVRAALTLARTHARTDLPREDQVALHSVVRRPRAG